jgi:hypothetical protein
MTSLAAAATATTAVRESGRMRHNPLIPAEEGGDTWDRLNSAGDGA